MMSVYGCKTKKDLKGKVGTAGDELFQETSFHGAEYRPDGTFCVVGPSPYERKWYAQVTVKAGIVTKVQ